MFTKIRSSPGATLAIVRRARAYISALLQAWRLARGCARFQLDEHIKAYFSICRFDDFGAVSVGIKVEVRTKTYPVTESALPLGDMEIDSL